MTAISLTHTAGTFIGTDGQYVACVECGEMVMLSITADLDDRSNDPSLVLCPLGHVWPAPTVPRWAAADILQFIIDFAPDAWPNAMNVLAEHGTISAPSMTLRLVDGPGRPGAG